MPKVSVIIPTYNRESVVCDAIDSVLSQTLEDLEVIVIDDGSIDATKSVIDALDDPRVSYYFKSNGGPASARNLGLSKVTGEYIAFLDSDDLWPINYLEAMIEKLEGDEQYGAVYCPITLVYTDGRQEKSYKRPEGKSGWICAELFRNSFIWIFAAVFRSSAWGGNRFDENIGSSSEDSDVILRLSKDIQFAFVSGVEVLHRVSADSISKIQGRNLNRVLSQQRFYHQIGGDKMVPVRLARKRLSYSFRRVAEDARDRKERSAAMTLYIKALKYWPFDLRLYVGLARAIFIMKDTNPNWQMPKPLDATIKSNY